MWCRCSETGAPPTFDDNVEAATRLASGLAGRADFCARAGGLSSVPWRCVSVGRRFQHHQTRGVALPSRPLANLVPTGRHPAILSADPHDLLVGLPSVGAASAALPSGEHAASCLQRGASLGGSSAVECPRRVARRGVVRPASGQCRIRRLDHRTQEHPFWRVLSGFHPCRVEVLAVGSTFSPIGGEGARRADEGCPPARGPPTRSPLFSIFSRFGAKPRPSPCPLSSRSCSGGNAARLRAATRCSSRHSSPSASPRG